MADILSTVSFSGAEGTPTGTGDFYTSLVSWEAAQQQNLATGLNTATVECFKDDINWPTGLQERLYIDEWGTSGDYYITIKAGAGSAHLGVPGAGFMLVNPSTGAAGLDTREDCVFEDFETIQEVSGEVGVNFRRVGGGTKAHLTRMIVNGNGSGYTVAQGSEYTDIQWTSSLFRGGRGLNPRAASAGAITNCTIDGLGVGQWGIIATGAAPNILMRNIVAVNTTSQNFYDPRAMEVSFSASEDTTATDTYPNGVSLISLVAGVDFTDLPNDDYTIINTTSGGRLDDAGTNVVLPLTDIAGNAFANPPAIGAFEIAFVGPVAINFVGTISDITGIEAIPITPVDVSANFSGTETPFTYAETGTAWPAWAILDPNTGIITGTPPSAATTSNHTVTGTDTATDTAVSNAFQFIISAPPPQDLSTLSAGGNEGTPTGDGDFYTTMDTWESAQQADLVAKGKTNTVDCYAYTDSGTVSTTITGWTTDATYYVTAKNADGVPTGTFGSGYVLNKTSLVFLEFSYALELDQAFTEIHGIEVIVVAGGGGLRMSNFPNNVVKNTIVNVLNQNDLSPFGVRSTSGFDGTNLLVLVGPNLDVGNEIGIFASGPANLDNCTVIITGTGGGTGIENNLAGASTVNCVSVGATTDFDIGVLGNNNASGDLTGDVTGVVITDGVDFVSPSTDDYTATSTGKLANAAIDLSAEFDDDITGALR